MGELEDNEERGRNKKMKREKRRERHALKCAVFVPRCDITSFALD
jgi:hypothetical protein